MNIEMKSCLLRSGTQYRIRWIPEDHAARGWIEFEDDRRWHVILIYSAKRKFEWKEAK